VLAMRAVAGILAVVLVANRVAGLEADVAGSKVGCAG
jgi:hypothetical protein